MEEKRPHTSTVRRPSGAAQVQYRLYFLQGAERRISFSHEFEADDDEQAIRIAESWREGRGAELWTGSRKVKSWDPDRY